MLLAIWHCTTYFIWEWVLKGFNSYFVTPCWYILSSELFMLNFLPQTIDISKVQTLLYHFPDGKVLKLEIQNIDQLATLEFELGRFCDTSAINGILHFYPRGNSWPFHRNSFFFHFLSIKNSIFLPICRSKLKEYFFLFLSCIYSHFTVKCSLWNQPW